MVTEEDLIEETLGPLTLDQIEEQIAGLAHEAELWLEISDLLRQMKKDRKKQK